MTSQPLAAGSEPAPIVLRAPSQYAPASAAASVAFAAPSDDWLLRTWSVTHSTLRMWRSAQNVRIRYKAGTAGGNQDRVEYEALAKDSKTRGKVKVVEGANTPDPTTPAAFDWRGRGWLFFVTSHWEILGWGEVPRGDSGTDCERWAVTWFAATLFTAEGIDFYSDRPEGLSPATVAAIQKAADAWPPKLAALARELQPVAIQLPWQDA